MYIRKNHLTIGEDPEIYEIVSDDGRTVHWSGTEDELSSILNDDRWCSGSFVARYGVSSFSGQAAERWRIVRGWW